MRGVAHGKDKMLASGRGQDVMDAAPPLADGRSAANRSWRRVAVDTPASTCIRANVFVSMAPPSQPSRP
jgi:hypothetical protein